MKKTIQLMGIATVVLATGFANAEPLAMKKVDTKSITVSFSRSETQSLEGAQGLYAKLHSAAEEVCAQLIAPEGPSRQDYRSCVSTSLGNAVTEANVPLLSLLHGDRSAVVAQVAR